MMYECHECGCEYKKIGNHWNHGECSYPDISEGQHEIITGMLMGDASINNTCSNPRLQCNMISREYLKYIDSKFPVIGSGVRLKRSAGENAELSRQSGFTTMVNDENYNDQYRWQTLSNPHLSVYSDWYSSGKKVWPDSIKLTSTTLKHWYCCDGSIEKNGSHYRIKITISNEFNNTEKINEMFKQFNLPEPDNWHSNKDIRWNKSNSDHLLEYMGKPLPGFEYKWPETLNY